MVRRKRGGGVYGVAALCGLASSSVCVFFKRCLVWSLHVLSCVIWTMEGLGRNGTLEVTCTVSVSKKEKTKVSFF